MLVVAAPAGNALLRRGEPADAQTQRRNITAAVEALAQIARYHRVVITHGNGPQVGLLALQAEPYEQVAPYPLDAQDPAFQHPSKPIGPIYGRAAAQRLARERDRAVAPDGEHWRRVVPSPEPQRIAQLQTIRTLAGQAGTQIISASDESPLAASEDAIGRLDERPEELDQDIRTTSRLAGQAGTAKRADGDRTPRAAGATVR